MMQILGKEDMFVISHIKADFTKTVKTHDDILHELELLDKDTKIREEFLSTFLLPEFSIRDYYIKCGNNKLDILIKYINK